MRIGLIETITALVGTAFITVTGIFRTGIVVESYEAIAPENAYTVLVYMNGSDLEGDYGAATADLGEMEEALQAINASSETVRIVIEAGGSTGWEHEVMEDADYGRFCITSEGVADFTEMDTRNMGEADTLADFINYGIGAYPAEHYILIFWNHGSGTIEGFGSDSNYEGDALTLTEIELAFQMSDMTSTFDLICFDACLMGTIETVSTLNEYAEYMIASAELEPEEGYDYSWLEIFAEYRADEYTENALDTELIGSTILQTYISYYGEKYTLSLALIDMSTYEAFEETVGLLVENISYDDTFYHYLGGVRDDLQGFGNENGIESAEAVDAMALLNVLGQYTDNEGLLAQLETIYSELVIEVASTGYQGDMSGLSIYLPSGSNEMASSDILEYKNITFCEAYQTFATEYVEFLDVDNEWTWAEMEVSENMAGNVIKVKLDSEDIESVTAAYLATFVQINEEGVGYLISSDSDVTIYNNGTITATTEDEFWGLQGVGLCMIEVYHDMGATEYTVPILYNGEQCNMTILFNTENQNGQITEIIPVETSKQIHHLEEGDNIVPLYPIEGLDYQESFDAEMEDWYYGDGYYRGEEIVIADLEAGDGELELVTMETEELRYGFMIKDNKQKVYYILESWEVENDK